MSKHLNLSTVIDKNKINSENTFLILIEAYVVDYNGDPVETLRIVKNSENIIFRGNTYQAASFDINITMEVNQEPNITLKAVDYSRTLGQYVDLYDGLVNNKVKMLVVNSGSLTAPPEMEEEFIIVKSDIKDYEVTIELGVETAVAQRFPNYRQFKERCAWVYKGPRCKYAGALPSCDYSRTGVNGCSVHNNEINFGGFPGINDTV